MSLPLSTEQKASIQSTSRIGRTAWKTIKSISLLAYVRTDFFFSFANQATNPTGQSQTVGPGVEELGQNTGHLLLCYIFLLHLHSPKYVPSGHVWYARLLLLPASGQKDGGPDLQKQPGRRLPLPASRTITTQVFS